MKNILLAVTVVLSLNSATASDIASIEIHKHKTMTTYGAIAWQEVNPQGENPIILIHGNSQSSKVFGKQLNDPRFTQRLIAVDLPGHGESDNALNPEVTYSFKGYAEAILEFMDMEDIPEAIMFGWSLGAHAAIDMANLEPDRVKGLFLTGAPPIDLTMEGFKEGFKPFDGIELISHPVEFTREQAVSLLGLVSIKEDEFPGLVEDNMRTEGKARALMIANALSGKEKSHKEIIQEIYIPIGIVQGRDDVGINGEYIKSLKYKNLKGYYELPTNHSTFVEAPDAFNQLLLEFSNEVWGN